MTHPNDDFIKKFLGNQKPEVNIKKQRLDEYYKQLNSPKNVLDESTKKQLVDTATKIFKNKTRTTVDETFVHPSEQRNESLRQERNQKLYEKEQQIRKARLEEYYSNKVKRDTVSSSSLDSVIGSLNTIKTKTITEATKGGWIEKKTPFGIFYFNTEEQVWMNSLGVVKKDFNEFFDIADMESTDNGPAPIFSASNLVKVLSFSDEGSYLTGYAEDNQGNGYINVYSLNYGASVTPTLEHTITLGGITFDGATGQRCLVSESGEYVVLASPDIKTVYFFDAAQDSLLQTITEDYPQFGEKIAADKDFYGMAISTNELTRSPDSFDGRITSFAVSSPICYYKRNFESTSIQRFKKIHTANAHTVSKHNGLASFVGLGLRINTTEAPLDPPAGSLYNTVGINRCSDLVSKGYNFALSNISKEADQILYKAHFPNLSNSKYDVVRDAGFTFQPNNADNLIYKMMTATGGFTLAPGVTYPASVLSDSFLSNTTQSNYFMQGSFGLKPFTIVRKIDNSFVYDGSYLNPGLINVISPPELKSIRNSNVINSGYSGYFMEKMYGKYDQPFGDDGQGRPSPSPGNRTWDYLERQNYYKEETVSSKSCINGSDVYNVTKFITDSIRGSGTTAATQNLNMLNIRIHRFPNTNAEGTDTYFYNDAKYQGNTFAYDPSFEPYGLLKVLFLSTDETNLNNALNAAPSTSFNIPAPILADPPLCPDSEFATTVSSDLLNQDLVSSFASDDYVFVNMTNNTLVFEIDTTKTYKPLLLATTLNESLSEYAFTYNASGEFFTKNKNIYKYNRTTNQLDLIGSLA